MAIGFHYDDIEWESYYNEQNDFHPRPYNPNVDMAYTKIGNNTDSKLLLCRDTQLGDLQNLKDGTVVIVYSD